MKERKNWWAEEKKQEKRACGCDLGPSREGHTQSALVAPSLVTGTALTCCSHRTTGLCSCYMFALATGVHVHLWQHHKHTTKNKTVHFVYALIMCATMFKSNWNLDASKQRCFMLLPTPPLCSSAVWLSSPTAGGPWFPVVRSQANSRNRQQPLSQGWSPAEHQVQPQPSTNTWIKDLAFGKESRSCWYSTDLLRLGLETTWPQ